MFHRVVSHIVLFTTIQACCYAIVANFALSVGRGKVIHAAGSVFQSVLLTGRISICASRWLNEDR